MRQYIKFFLVFVLAVGVSACGNARHKVKIVTYSVTGTETASTVQPLPDETGSTSDAIQADRESTEELASLDPESEPVQSEVDDDPETLLGIDAQQLVGILGDPSLLRSENPAEIWQYSTKSCVLDVVFYDTVTTYIEARDDQVKPMDSRLCLRKLLLSRENL